MRSCISIRGFVHPSVRRSIRRSVSRSVSPAFVETWIYSIFLRWLDIFTVGMCYKDALCEVPSWKKRTHRLQSLAARDTRNAMRLLGGRSPKKDNGLTDLRTDTPSYRNAWPHQKIEYHEITKRKETWLFHRVVLDFNSKPFEYSVSSKTAKSRFNALAYNENRSITNSLSDPWTWY